ncbi:hypothetical protein CLPU_17c00320 [Gottschalkia purinilytica]|uniref:Mg2+ and Co2+ transporter CorB n=1 Tax=Gottschalkia purinilytica TaxID=1503 RepID=A0A0L0W7G8_GOTPU|nr:hypothetical protein [Gottschalkia purinilytica]KNF07407.1 hypothetical protein CLPU_17c00320 [Gottschalkia purinilytica]
MNKDKKSLIDLDIFKKYNVKWILSISIWTFALAIGVSLISENILRNLDILMAVISLIGIIIIGVVFDIIGISVAVSDEKIFHSMAANNIKEAKYAIKLVRNAGQVSNFCNDVIGDICGIISGSAGAIIVLRLINQYGFKEGTFVSIVMTGIIASLTVGGKAIGKEIAIYNSEKIIFRVSKIFMFLHTKLGIRVLPSLKKKKKK